MMRNAAENAGRCCMPHASPRALVKPVVVAYRFHAIHVLRLLDGGGHGSAALSSDEGALDCCFVEMAFYRPTIQLDIPSRNID